MAKKHEKSEKEKLEKKRLDAEIDRMEKAFFEKKKEEKKPKKEREEKPSKKKKPEKMEKEEGYNPWKILTYPHLAEKSMNMVELENKLIFIVKKQAKKQEIKEAVEKGFAVKVTAVSVEITRKGQKKAYVKLSPEYSAADIASRLGMI